MATKKKPDVQPPETTQVVNEEYALVGVDKLTEHPANPRKGDVDAIRVSIEANGFYGAVVAQKSTGRILAGNHRWKAARAAGLTQVPVLWADVDDATATRILLADNRTNDMASYDDAALAELLEEARQDGNLLGTGYNDVDVEELLNKLADLPLPEGDADTDDDGDRAWGVIVEVQSEADQVELLESLSAQGLEVRALMK